MIIDIGGLLFSEEENEGEWVWEQSGKVVVELGGMEEGENLVGIYYMREEYLFSIK